MKSISEIHKKIHNWLFTDIISAMNGKAKKIYTVNDINVLIKSALENSLPGRLSICAEISNWKDHASGHRYFILKDKKSQIPAVMWKGNAAKLNFEPENGTEVVATGHIDVYPPHGKYQFIVDNMKPQGVGDLQVAFERLVDKLRSQGFFEDSNKKQLPRYPFNIAIITSKSGAAVHDISDSIHSRWPCAKLSLYPVPVQGAGSASEIASAIANINKNNSEYGFDLLIVGRGGGSMEDLWCFNEEIVAKAIFNSKIPIISAVGHEVDTTIADLVADARASTPTKAGVIAVPDINDLLSSLSEYSARIKRKIVADTSLYHQKLDTIEACAAFKDPLYSIRYKSQEIEQLQSSLKQAFSAKQRASIELISRLESNLRRVDPLLIISKQKLALLNLDQKLKQALVKLTAKHRLVLASLVGQLTGLNPRSILKRGYSITRVKDTNEIISENSNIKQKMIIVTEFGDNKMIESEVKNIENNNKNEVLKNV